ncbi:MAG: hypothetical protein ABIQ05_03405, partial [Candidatus Limnocylindria bacterium]
MTFFEGFASFAWASTAAAASGSAGSAAGSAAASGSAAVEFVGRNILSPVPETFSPTFRDFQLLTIVLKPTRQAGC